MPFLPGRRNVAPRLPHRSRRLRRLALSTALLALTALGATACAGSGWTYVKNSEVGAYFKVPSSWKVFRENEILNENLSGVSPQSLDALRRAVWMVGFDGSPHPSVGNLLSVKSPEPNGIARVKQLTGEERDNLSLASLRNQLIPVDEYLQQKRAEQIDAKDITAPGGLRGSRTLFNVLVGKQFFTFEQVVLVDNPTRRVYALFVGCEAHCYRRNQRVIRDVVDSWTVKER